MNRTKSLKGPCQQCGGRLEFPAEIIGTTVQCPHCGQPTELMLATPPAPDGLPRRALLWSGIAALILVLGLFGLLVAFKRAQNWAARQKGLALSQRPGGEAASPTSSPPTESGPLAKTGFHASEIAFEQPAGSSLLYAVGSLTNATQRQRFGVKLQLDLLDEAGQKLGTAKDYAATLEPGGTWHFKALVVETKAVSAKIAAVAEDQ